MTETSFTSPMNELESESKGFKVLLCECKQEEEAHFMRLVSVLHDLLVSQTATKEKREELHKYITDSSTWMFC